MPRSRLVRDETEAPDARLLLEALKAAARGDRHVRLPVGKSGLVGDLYRACNTLLEDNQRLARALERVSAELARVIGGVAADDVGAMAADLITHIRAIAEVVGAVTQGDLTRAIDVQARGEVGALCRSVNQMIANLRDTTRQNSEQDWLKTNLARFTRMLQGHRDRAALAALVLRELTPLVRAQVGLFYIAEVDEVGGGSSRALRLLSRYAHPDGDRPGRTLRFGEGLVGQCALEQRRILLTEVPDDYLKISSGLGEARPRSLVVLPVVFEGEIRAVIELASLHEFGAIHLAFLDQLTESIGIVLHTIAASTRTEELLAQSQSLAEELRGQQLELTATNRRLEQQARALRASEERLRLQQDQLQRENQDLERRSQLLELQNAEVERQNREIARAKVELEERAQQLLLSSKYKSEFLANMSHELRTPLNSLLILAQLLADNPEGNLDAKQVEFARTIHSAGSELLSLISDILDLSKIESGAMGIDIDELVVDGLRDQLERGFRPVAETRRLEFDITIAAGVPPVILTDPRRLLQVLKNLLSNAFKFTHRGGVELRIAPASDPEGRGRAMLAFSVSDTGIGIPQHKQRLIFEAFQQADGTTSRKYGGTGLGLSISREIARLLGGEIVVESTPDVGSTFTLLVPLNSEAVLVAAAGARGEARPSERLEAAPPGVVDDDRARLGPGARSLLIIEDDPAFARLLLDLAREHGFCGVVAARGDDGLALARELRPDAVTLDVRLPGLDGWTVLDRLKQDPRTRPIPVHLISGVDREAGARALRGGAFAYLPKPVSREALAAALAGVRRFVERGVRDLLLVEDDARQRQAIAELLGDDGVATTAVGSAGEGLELLRERRFDCAIVDLGLPDMTGFDLLRTIRGDPRLVGLPIVVYTGKDLSADEEVELGRLTEAVVLKGERSMERLLRETAVFLDRLGVQPQARAPRPPAPGNDVDPVLGGKTVLIVDDDVRNIFAVTSVLERHHMRVLYADDGRTGLALLREHPEVHAILLDVMMPGMDGYEATREIRKDPRFTALPIITLTAKAMRGDREKCLAAGASDYITKPVEPERLLALLRAWLSA